MATTISGAGSLDPWPRYPASSSSSYAPAAENHAVQRHPTGALPHIRPPSSASGYDTRYQQPPPPRPPSSVASVPSSLPRRAQYTIDQFRLGEVLGRGAWGEVFAAFTSLPEFTGIPLAIKRIPRANVRAPAARRRVHNEITIQARLRHPAIVRLYASFADDAYIYLLLESCDGGALSDYVAVRGRLSEPEVRFVLRQVVEGMRYLASQRVMHRDLKPGNLLLTGSHDIKIADFGLATEESPAQQQQQQHTSGPPRAMAGRARLNQQTICGTPNYIAPEIVAKKGYDSAAELWSIGCLLVTLLTGKPPFENEDGAIEETLTRTMVGKYELPRGIDISRDARDLIASLLQVDPVRRLPLDEVLAHPFFAPHLPEMRLPALADSNTPTTAQPVERPKSGVAGSSSGSASNFAALQTAHPVHEQYNAPATTSRSRQPARVSSATFESAPAPPLTSAVAPPRRTASRQPRSAVPSHSHFAHPPPLQRTTSAVTATDGTHPGPVGDMPSSLPGLIPLSTARLRPVRHKFRGGVAELIPASIAGSSPDVIMRFDEGPPLRVSGDGERVTFDGRHYTLATLPAVAVPKYRTAATFVAKLRATLPRVIMYSPQARVTLMDTGHDAEAVFSSAEGETRIRIVNDETVRVYPPGAQAPAAQFSLLETHRFPKYSHLISHVQHCLRECRVADTESQAPGRPQPNYPLVVRAAGGMAGEHDQMTCAPPRQPSSARSSVASYYPRSASTLQQSEHRSTGYGCDRTDSAVGSSESASPSSHAPQSARPNHHRRTPSHLSTGSTAVMTCDTPLAQGALDDLAVARIFVPHVGWCTRSRAQLFSVYFLDGAVLAVDHQARLLEYGAAPSSAIAGGEPAIVETRRYKLDRTLPEEVKRRLLAYRDCVAELQRRGTRAG